MVKKNKMWPAVKMRFTFFLTVWHLFLWAIAALLFPAYWLYLLIWGLISYLGSLGAFAIWQRKTTVKGRVFERFPPAMQIAHETLSVLRRGLNEETAQTVAEIIQKISDVPAVAITDREKVLAFLGEGCEHHPVGMPIVTKPTRDVIAHNKHIIVRNRKEFNCSKTDCHCPLGSAIIVPLTCRQQVAGTIKLYQTKEGNVPDYLIKLAQGIAQLLSNQIELAEMDRQAQLVTEARLDALQAQINPHFLFNTLNTTTAMD